MWRPYRTRFLGCICVPRVHTLGWYVVSFQDTADISILSVFFDFAMYCAVRHPIFRAQSLKTHSILSVSPSPLRMIHDGEKFKIALFERDRLHFDVFDTSAGLFIGV